MIEEFGIKKFIDLLSSEAPAPGGGAAAALTGALGLALTGMVANLTTGKEKFKENEELVKNIIEESVELQKLFIQAIDKDIKAYEGVMNAYKLPKNTEDEKRTRVETLETSLKFATIAPFEVMSFSLIALNLTKKALGKTNPNVATDLGVAAVNLKSAIQGSWLNVLINLKYIKDKTFAEDYKSKGEKILSESILVADEIYEVVVGELR